MIPNLYQDTLKYSKWKLELTIQNNNQKLRHSGAFLYVIMPITASAGIILH